VTVANTYPAQVQEALDVYSVTVVQGAPGASATLTLHDQPCAASGVALDALCLPIVILVGMGLMGQGAWLTTESLTGAVQSYNTPSRIPTHLPVPVPVPHPNTGVTLTVSLPERFPAAMPPNATATLINTANLQSPALAVAQASPAFATGSGVRSTGVQAWVDGLYTGCNAGQVRCLRACPYMFHSSMHPWGALRCSIPQPLPSSSQPPLPPPPQPATHRCWLQGPRPWQCAPPIALPASMSSLCTH
jgi:hypothetical protein